MAHTASTRARTGQRPHIDASRQEVQQFFDRFADALTSGDVATVVSLWQVPAFVLGDADDRAVSSNQEIEQFFGGAKQHYNEQGIMSTRAEIGSLQWLTKRIAIVQVRWPYLDAQGHEVGEETSTYTLRRDEEGELRLRVTVMHGAAGQTKHIGKPQH